jgi:hypothetical protein
MASSRTLAEVPVWFFNLFAGSASGQGMLGPGQRIGLVRDLNMAQTRPGLSRLLPVHRASRYRDFFDHMRFLFWKHGPQEDLQEVPYFGRAPGVLWMPP